MNKHTILHRSSSVPDLGHIREIWDPAIDRSVPKYQIQIWDRGYKKVSFSDNALSSPQSYKNKKPKHFITSLHRIMECYSYNSFTAAYLQATDVSRWLVVGAQERFRI